jgi:pilus assembly protein CpaE
VTRVLVLTDSADVADRFGYATERTCLTLPADPLPRSAAELFQMLAGGPLPHVVVIHPADADIEDALALAQTVDFDHGIGVVLVSDRQDIGYQAMRAGVRDLVPTTAEVPALRASLDHAAAFALAREAGAAAVPAPSHGPMGRVITIASPKGGVGKTTVATNLAVGIAKRFPQQVVLVDLDVHFGDVASSLNLAPEFTLPDTVRGAAQHDALALKSLLTAHDTGLLVLPGSESPVAADSVTAKDVHRLLELLAAGFAFVVVDTSPGLSEHTLAVLDQSSELIMVTSMDVPGVRGLRKEIETLRELDLLLDARHIVLNFTDDSRGMSVKDVEATIGEDVDVVLPQSKVVPMSTNQGIPLVQSGGKDPVTRQLNGLVDRLVGAEAKPKSGLFGRRTQ